MKHLGLIVLICGIGYGSSIMAQQAMVVSASGQVEISTGLEVQKIVGAGNQVELDSLIKTGSNGDLTIALLNGLAVTLKEDSEMRILELTDVPATEGKRTALVELNSGRLVVLIAEDRAEEVEFRIKTPKGIASPRGTFYAIQVEGEEAFLAVKEGKVGLDQFTPLEYEDQTQETAVIQEVRDYGETTTTSPRG
ncbi:MAG: FecR family protein [Verrucomicrobiota bacterium]